MKKVSVILLNWNGGRYTIPCIESLRKSSHHDLQIIVVDNGSTDGSDGHISRTFPETVVIKNPVNVGFAEGNNIGIRYALQEGADYVLILNNDTLVDREMIAELIAATRASDDLVAACPKIYWLRDPNRLWFAGSRANLWTGVFSHVGMNQLDSSRYGNVEEIDFASGCCIFAPRRIIEAVGMFDARYFIYCEDVDWSVRCLRAGFRLLYVPKAKLWHVESGTTGDMTPQKRYLATRNNIWTVRKHAHPLQKLVFVLFFYPIRALGHIAGMALSMQWRGVLAEVKGARDGFWAPL